MKYKKVKRIKEELSVIGFGCWGISGENVWNNCNDDDSIRAIHCAIDLGINFFDVAPVYGFGHAEEVLGKALKDVNREKLIIASKCGFVWEEGIKNVHKELSYKSILKEIDDTLRRLNMDYIDIYQLHWPDHNTQIEESMEAILKIKEAGKIRYVGVSNFPVSLTERAEKCVEIASQQGLYNMLERNAKTYYNHVLEYRTEKELLPYTKENGQAFLPYSPLLQGLLTGSFKRNDNYNEKDIRNHNIKLNGNLFERYYEASLKLEKIASDINVPLNQVALQWLIQKDEVTTVLTGALNEEQIVSNAKACEVELKEDTLKKINEVILDFEFEE